MLPSLQSKSWYIHDVTLLEDWASWKTHLSIACKSLWSFFDQNALYPHETYWAHLVEALSFVQVSSPSAATPLMATGEHNSSSHIENTHPSTINSSVYDPPPFRCSRCNFNQGNTRNLVVCIDGTSNQFGQNNTNVVKMFSKIDLERKNPKQYAYYSSGIGTHPKSPYSSDSLQRKIYDALDMAVALNIDEIVKDAYGWLARTYQEGDQIYLFGFSRGAYQVRVLAGMIYEVGLIRTPTEQLIGSAYEHYGRIRQEKPDTRIFARKFKNTFSWKDLQVHFVGVWDTVSSVGFGREDVFLSTSLSAPHACHFRHALALDERRVMFIPEYFRETNSEADDWKSKSYITPNEDETSSTSGKYRSTVHSDGGNIVSEGTKQRTTEIKEVWFAGSHSDVGGMDNPGTSYQAGNISLLWMRREAIEKGLVLQPTDIVWMPDDLNFGITNSLKNAWKIVEYLPIKHRVFFTGGRTDAWRWHRSCPRRIIPGQRIHASILYANAYRPCASFGEGFELSIENSLDTEVDGQLGIWEGGLFDDSAAQGLFDALNSPAGVAPIHIDRLLFMLRSKEGKRCIRNVKDWQNNFLNRIIDRNCVPLIRLVTIVAYYEVSHSPDAPKGSVQPLAEFSSDILNSVKQGLHAILAAHKHRDGPRVVALLRPLVNHKGLRENLLTEDVLDTLVRFLDMIISQKGRNFGQAIDGLSSLLECEQTQGFIVKKLSDEYPGFGISRLGRILGAKDTHLLTAALRMVMAMTRIPQDAVRTACSAVKPRIRELAKGSDRLVGLLAVEILLALYNPADPEQLDIRNSNVRANLASALVRWNPDSRGSRQETLKRIFGLDAAELAPRERKLLRALTYAIWKGNARERTAATMTLLKLCESEVIRRHLYEINLLDILVNQLRSKDKALLAAYALANCLRYSDMKSMLKTNEQLPKNIVGMLRLNYFDGAIGEVEGFQVFGEFMQHTDLWVNTTIRDDMMKVVSEKMKKGNSKEIRASLICLDIIKNFDENDPWIQGLVDSSITLLWEPEWRSQKAAVSILLALTQTDYGVAAIIPRVSSIIQMLLGTGYLPLPSQGTSPTDQTVLDPDEDSSSPSTSSMLGPACALRVLAQKKKLRDFIRYRAEYGALKYMHFSRTLVGDMNVRRWRVRTPNKNDVTDMIDKMIKTVEEELPEEGLMSIRDAVLPRIRHWNLL